MKDKKRISNKDVLLLCCMTIIIILAVSEMIKYHVDNHKLKNCLKEIGKELCLDKGEVFVTSSTINFGCKKDDRDISFTRYNFLKSEIERCRQ